MRFFDPKQLSGEHLTSVAPVREAMLRLSERGLLRWERNRGFFVQKLPASANVFHLEQLRFSYKFSLHRLSLESNAGGNLGGMPSDRYEKHSAGYLELAADIQLRFFSDQENDVVNLLWDRIWLARNSYLSDPEVAGFLHEKATHLKRAVDAKDLPMAAQLIDQSFDFVIERLPHYVNKLSS